MKRILWTGVLSVLLLLLTLLVGYAPFPPRLSVQMSNPDALMGHTIQANLLLHHAGPVRDAQVHLRYDPAILHVVSVEPGDLVPGQAGQISAQYDNQNGALSLSLSSLAADARPSTTGKLCSVTFETLSQGTSTVAADNILLTDGQGTPLNTSAGVSSSFTVNPMPKLSTAGGAALLGAWLLGVVVTFRRRLF